MPVLEELALPGPEPAVEPLEVEAYCMKCQEKRPVRDAALVTMKNGRLAMIGRCTVCGSKVYRIGGPGSIRSAA